MHYQNIKDSLPERRIGFQLPMNTVIVLSLCLVMVLVGKLCFWNYEACKFNFSGGPREDSKPEKIV